MTVTTTKHQDYMGRWLNNPHPGTTTNAKDFLGCAIITGNKDRLGRALTFSDPSAWTTAHTYVAGDYVKAATGTDYDAVFVALDGGTSHATTEPTWPVALYGTVIDNPGVNQITWKCIYL
jgi:hypothetical protein